MKIKYKIVNMFQAFSWLVQNSSRLTVSSQLTILSRFQWGVLLVYALIAVNAPIMRIVNFSIDMNAFNHWFLLLLLLLMCEVDVVLWANLGYFTAEFHFYNSKNHVGKNIATGNDMLGQWTGYLIPRRKCCIIHNFLVT